MCGYMICLTGFSYGLGGDKFVYMSEFESYPENLSEASDFIWMQFMLKGQMPLWTMLNITAKMLFGSFYAVQIVQSAMVNIAICYIATKYTKRLFLFLLIYFFTLDYFLFNTEIMREGIAIAFILFGMYGWMNGRKWLFFIMFPLALLFHISAVIALLFPFVRIKISWKTLGITFGVAFVIWILSDLILNRIMIAVLGGMGALVQKVLFYSIQASTIFGFLRSSLTYLIFPFIIMHTAIKFEPSEEIKRQKEKMAAFMLVLALLACSLAGFNRFYNYTKVFYLIMFADFIYIIATQREHIIMRIGTFAGTVFLIFLSYIAQYKITGQRFYEFYYPYTCILNEDKSVYIREITHFESTQAEENDKNVRDIK